MIYLKMQKSKSEIKNRYLPSVGFKPKVHIECNMLSNVKGTGKMDSCDVDNQIDVLLTSKILDKTVNRNEIE